MHRPSAGSWLSAAIDARERALEAAAPDARAPAAVRLARACSWAGEDARATRVLMTERRAQRLRGALGEAARCELGLTELALLCDDEDLAAVHLESAEEAPAEEAPVRALLAAWIRARRGNPRPFGDPPRILPIDDAPWAIELSDAIALELLWSSDDAAGLPVRGSDPRTRALFDIARAVRDGDTAAVRDALGSLEGSGLLRDLGRALLRVMAARPALLSSLCRPGEDLSRFIVKARAALGSADTWRDRVALRHAWHVHGRRHADRALPKDIALRLDAHDRTLAHVHSTVAVGLDRQMVMVDDLPPSEAVDALRDAADLLEASVDGALDELARAEVELSRLLAVAFSDRDRARTIATTLAGLADAASVDALAGSMVRLCTEQLDATAVVVAEREGDSIRAIAAHGIDESLEGNGRDEHWMEDVRPVLDEPVPSRPSRSPWSDRRGGTEAPVSGSVLVVPMRSAAMEGALYVDKRKTDGSFSASDQATLELLARFAAQAFPRIRGEHARAREQAARLLGSGPHYTFADLRGNDPALREAIEVARRAAVVDAPVLIVGESGTGKDLLAQAIHAAAPRSKEALVAVRCGAVPRDQLESELFDAERGALHLAAEGTVLLDEIDELPLHVQTKLVRALSDRAVRARIIATTERDLAADAERGLFRRELLDRLRVLQIALPPLRARGNDVVVLAHHLLRKIGERQGKAVREVAMDVESALTRYPWPGNVRELAVVLEREIDQLRADQLVLDRVPTQITHVRLEVETPAAPSVRESVAPSVRESVAPPSAMPPEAASIVPLAEVERLAYLDAYEKCHRSVTKAARALGVSKVTFYAKLRAFGMHPAETTGDMPAMRPASLLAKEAMDIVQAEASRITRRPPRG